jgi:hypothetical protein
MIRRTILTIVLMAGLVASGGLLENAHCGHRLGGGIHYLKTLGDIKEIPEWDSDAIGILASYQYNFSLIKIEADVEWVLDFGGTDKSLVQPQAWLIVGNLIYVAGGIGGSYYDGAWFDNPFYGLRAGTNLPLLGLNFDLFASYLFRTSQVFDEIDEEDLDELTFGLIVRFEL